MQKSSMRLCQEMIKRIFDFCVTGLVIVLLMPAFLVITALIKITMPGPIFFKQERIGRYGKPFSILKFRTMKIDNKAIAEFDSSKDNERITPLGHFLRRWKIDELPQLLNVFLGDMSIVGPRPTVQRAYDEDLTTETAKENGRKRLLVRPGLTGLAQVNGNVGLTWDERVYYDAKYVDHLSIGMDLGIIVKTIAVIVLGEQKFVKKVDEKNG